MTKILGVFNNARTRQSNCFWPPERFEPLSVMGYERLENIFLLIFVVSIGGARVELELADLDSWFVEGIGVAVPETETLPGFPIK